MIFISNDMYLSAVLGQEYLKITRHFVARILRRIYKDGLDTRLETS